MSGIEWSLKAKGTIYCITFALFIFIFLSSCSIVLSFPWASSWTVVKQHFTIPSHSWCIDPNTLLLHLGIDKIATEYLCSSKAMSINRQRRKKKSIICPNQNLADHYTPMLKANAHGHGSPKRPKLYSTHCQILWDGTKFTTDICTWTIVLSM